MKKQSMFCAIIMVFIMLFTVSVPALAATSTKTQKQDITLTALQNGDINPNDLKMTDSDKHKKLISIDKAAADYLIKNSKTLTVNTGDLTFNFSPAVFQCEAVDKASVAGSSISYRMTIDLGPSQNISTYFSDNAQEAQGNYRLDDNEFTLKMEIYADSLSYYNITDLAAPVKVTCKYYWDITDFNAKEANLTYAWLDIDAAENGKNADWYTMKSTVDVANDKMTATLTKGSGYYLLVSSKNGMGGSSATPNDDGGTGAYVGVPDGFWAADAITNLQNALVVPYNLAGINLNAPITRGQFASYLVGALRLNPNTNSDGQFTDVAADNSYYTAIYTGAASGIFKGVSATKFAPNAKITREEMAVMFERAMQNKAITINTDSAKLNGFKDVKKIASWALESGAAVVNAGLIQGQNGNYFAPKANATWAEAVMMLNRLYQQLY